MNKHELKAEAKRYGMHIPLGTDATEIDSMIQEQVSLDVRENTCSLCKGTLHTGRCSR